MEYSQAAHDSLALLDLTISIYLCQLTNNDQKQKAKNNTGSDALDTFRGNPLKAMAFRRPAGCAMGPRNVQPELTPPTKQTNHRFAIALVVIF